MAAVALEPYDRVSGTRADTNVALRPILHYSDEWKCNWTQSAHGHCQLETTLKTSTLYGIINSTKRINSSNEPNLTSFNVPYVPLIAVFNVHSEEDKGNDDANTGKHRDHNEESYADVRWHDDQCAPVYRWVETSCTKRWRRKASEPVKF